jgi:integral membrane protein
MLSSPLAFLRLAAIAEGISYLLFAITMPLKYYMEMPGPNMIVGMAHGFLFMLYIALVLYCAYQYKWSGKITVLSLLASIIPAGTFYAHAKWFRNPEEVTG